MLEVIVRPLALLDGWAALGPHRMWTPVSQPSPPFLQGVGQTFAVSETMNALKAEGKKALIPFLMAGDPNLETTAKALKVRDAFCLEAFLPCLLLLMKYSLFAWPFTDHG